MRALVQRVRSAWVEVDGTRVGEVGRGLLVYVAVAPEDREADAEFLADKLAQLRVFADAQGKLNVDVGQVGGGLLLVSAFTLLADARRGRRPSFDGAAGPELARPLIERVSERLRQLGVRVSTGSFGASMVVASENDGPICILIESRTRPAAQETP